MSESAQGNQVESTGSRDGFSLFVVFVVVAGIAMVMNPLLEDHVETLETDVAALSEAQEEQDDPGMATLVEYESYYLWSVTRIASEAAKVFELEEGMVLTVGAVGMVWSPLDLMDFTERYNANMRWVQEGVVDAALTADQVKKQLEVVAQERAKAEALANGKPDGEAAADAEGAEDNAGDADAADAEDNAGEAAEAEGSEANAAAEEGEAPAGEEPPEDAADGEEAADAAEAEAPEAEQPAVEEAKEVWKTYTVSSGDSLDKIASNNGCSVDDLIGWNDLKGTVIKPGQVLRVGKQ